MPEEEVIVILARLDERMKNIELRFSEFVTKTEIQPMRYILYGMVGTTLAGVVGAVIKVVTTQ